MGEENDNVEQTQAGEGQASKPARVPSYKIGVQFKTAGKIYTFLTDDKGLTKDDAVLVQADEGMSVGFVAVPAIDVREGEDVAGLKRVLKRASDEDIENSLKRREKALEFFEICRDKIAQHNLDMKLIDAEIVDGGKKIVFFFFAEQRVDFRGLVKDLAGALHMRIEMRQIGARDESKLVGSIGPCGLSTCCSTHLRQFKSISISMAKHQGLTPNPAKLTGMCGKLKCCLDYESEAYDELRKGLPKLGAAVECPKGTGKIVDLNILKRECGVQLYGGPITRCRCSELRMLDKEERDRAIKSAREPEVPDEQTAKRRDRDQRRRDRREGKKNGQG
jgi:cell fate regulator YaaT (PSP1 superfamily)